MGFKLFFFIGKLEQDLNSKGSAFHTSGAAWWKDFLPNVSKFLKGLASRNWLPDLRDLDGWYGVTKSFKYEGKLSKFRHL